MKGTHPVNSLATMTVVVKKPGEPWEIVRTPGTLFGLQTIVGGYIEIAWITSDYFKDGARLVVYCNEEGTFHQPPLPYNILSPNRGPIVGTIVATKERDGENIPMTDREVLLVLNHLTDYAAACEQMTPRPPN